MPPTVISLSDKFAGLAEPWVPTIVGALNGQLVKVVRFDGEYIWHSHADEDEMFLVVRGAIRIRFRDGDIELGPGELCVVPKGVEHKPVADQPAHVVLFEPSSTRNTGEVDHEYTIEAADLPASLGAASRKVEIRNARPEEFKELGRLVASVYSSLDEFPDKDEQPEYYEMLADIGRFADKPDSSLLVAVSEEEKLLGGVVYFSDMAQHGAGGTASREKNAAGFRLLAVDPDARGMGVGRALTQRCIHLAKEGKREQLIIHTTKAMEVAWRMYERLGFERSPDLDFMQEQLPAFGFRLDLGTTG